MIRIKRKSFNDKVKEQFKLICLNCQSEDVYIDYEQEGGYSEYTQWGSHVSIGCNACKQNDFYE